MTPSAFAAVTKLADEPLNVKNSAEPNIVLTLDDSTSMLSDFLPELVIDQYCRDGNGILQAACGVRPAVATDDYPAYIYHQNNVPYNAYDDGTGRSPLPPFNPPSGGSPPSRAQQWPAPAHNAAFNRLYYNPRITYEPPAYADGTSWPSMNSGNTTAWTLVPADPFKNPVAPLAATPKVNLTSPVNVGFWCNTDWTTATLRNDPMYCRTNGSGASSVAIAGPAYAASLMGPRPGAAYAGDANDGDYVLPWPKPGAAPNDTKYFSRNGTMSLWCDKTHPKWPKTNGTICITPGAPVAQTCIAAPTQSCNLQANPNNCSWSPKQYLPAGCDPLCVGAECGLCIEQKTAPCPNTFKCSLAGNACPAAAPAPASPACDRPKRCSTTASYNAGGAVCNVNADCPPIPTCSAYNQVPAASANCNTNWNGAPLKTLQADADSNGEVCRHNNGGTGYAATRWEYSAAHATYKTQVTGSCPATPDNVNVPRHYWKTSVEWCVNRIATGTGTDPWRGAGGSVCKAFRDTTTGHIWPRYYRFGKDPGTDNVTQPAFQRVDLHPSIAQYYHEWKDEAGDVVSVTRTYAEEMENYANWFAYYRTRIQAVKTATSLVFKELDNKFRVGFHTLANNPTSDFANVNYFDAAQKTAWFSKLYGVYIKTGRETPNLNAVVRVGEWYATGGHPELAAATDPIVPTLTCQKNWHMLFTDGITNQPAVPTTVVGNVDKLIPVLPEDLSVQGLVPGAPWPFLFRENATATSNSLADYVTYYWSKDFKPAMTNNVPASDRDPATWQHGNFAAMSLGTEGKLPAGNQSSTEDQIKAGTTQWSQTVPTVYKPDASGVDDLWHAAINGRGRFVNAQSVDELRLGMGQILKDIENQPGSRSGVTFDSVNLSDTNKFVYRVKFEPGWAGSLTKVEIDPTSGAEVLEKWRAADRLAEQLTVLPAPDDEPWFTKRKILTMNGTSTVPFLWGSLSAAQKDSLAPGKPTRGAQTVEYLRGDRSREGARLGQFRVRSGPLGDIVNSQPVIVGPSKVLFGTTDTPFYDPGLNPGYQAFFDANKTRQKTIFVAANDGMVHAFSDPAADDANLLPLPYPETSSGYETWAYVPKDLYRPDKTGLGGLTLQDGGLPPFTHHFYVDGPMRVADVDFGGTDWRTILVGGLGKGGKSFYALDVTTPVATADSESDIISAKKVLWEFTHPDMGYSYGKPLMVKTQAHGWVVILTSGYNNPSGDGKVYFVDPKTGTLLTSAGFPGYLSTGAGTAGTPSGLTQVSGYVRNFRNQVVDQLYAGDLLGNLWRFDVRDADPKFWSVTKLAVVTDPGGTAQPITSPPQIEIDLATGADRWVFVGTGRLLHDDDLVGPYQTQSVYAIRDGNVKDFETAGVFPRTRGDLAVVSDAAGLASRPAYGWIDDLEDAAGQRVVVPVQAELSVIAYVATQPPGPDKCLTGQPSRVYAREFSRGNSRLQEVSGGPFVESIYVAEGAVGIELITLKSPLAAGSYIPEIRLGITRGSDGKLVPILIKLPDSVSKHRMSWRLLGEII
jgi:type IV pilus assembly protein PilY1